jgi:acetyltransferase-like isoleucine patch superfamily enzyme
MLFKIKKKIVSSIQYLLYKNTLNISGYFSKGKNVRILNSNINVLKNAKLVIDANVEITNFDITILSGEVTIGSNTRLSNGSKKSNASIYISDGFLNISDNCFIKADFSIRFGGKCNIGSYTGIMERTEIRCDHLIEIGDYNMISYECMIYDTNTHCLYTKEKRRDMTRRDFPLIGQEYEKPVTSPVKIGNDCWIGKRAVILKGSTIGDECIVGALAVITKRVNDNTLCYGNSAVCRPRS